MQAADANTAAAEQDAQPAAGGARRRDARREEHDAAVRAEREEQAEKQTKKQEKYSAKLAEREAARLAAEEEERKAAEEKARKEHEEYLLWKDMFGVEAEGERAGEAEQENALERFVDTIRMNKVVMLEDLSAQFKMKTAAVVSRIEDLEKQGQLSGIFDDRGKYVYITPDELESVQSFIKSQGRVSHAEVVQAANRLVRLQPTEADRKVLEEQRRAAAAELEDEKEAQGDGD